MKLCPQLWRLQLLRVNAGAGKEAVKHSCWGTEVLGAAGETLPSPGIFFCSFIHPSRMVQSLVLHTGEQLTLAPAVAGSREPQLRGVPVFPCVRWQPGTAPHTWGSLPQHHWNRAAKPWPQEILISRNKCLFRLKGWAFPTV